MARQIYGADGSAQVVSPTGTPTVAAATVYTARTGGTVVTDIQNMSNANLGGVVTPDARGQIIFQGPDGSTATYWLDFGDGGPRWGVRPVDISAMMTAAMIARDLANYTTAGGTTAKAGLPYTTQSPSQSLAVALDGLVIPRFASSGARDTAFPSPANGDRCYRTDLAAHQTYRSGLGAGSRWVTDMAVIQEQRLSADAGTVDFANIPADWTNLVLKYRARASGSVSTDTITQRVGLRFNNDGGSNYASYGFVRMSKLVSSAYTHEVAKDGSGGTTTTTTAANYAGTAGTSASTSVGGLTNYFVSNVTTNHIGVCPGSSAPASLFGGGEITIEEYSSGNNRKAIKCVSGFGDGSGIAGTGYFSHAQVQGGWNSNAAINRITLYPVSSTAFAAGSYFALYGWS